MSTEARPGTPRPPSESPPTARKPSLFQKLKQKQPPPTAFETHAKSRRSHQRSSSLGAFVQRILPSHREEKGYTLRQQYEDNSTQDPVDLVFGVSDTKASDVLQSPEPGDGGMARKTRSWSPRKSVGRDTDGRSGGIGARDELPTGSQRDDNGTVFQAYTRAPRSWGQAFGLKKEKAVKGEGEHFHQHANEEPEAAIPLLSIDIPELESGMTKTQQMYKDKKAKRQQRRSLRDSGDFLGVQGANPRTGYWDVSSGTSSSEPSQMSEETKKKFDEEAKDIEEKKRRYEEAQAKHQAELSRVQSLRDNKKKEKEMRKKLEQKMKQRRHGKWKLNENGWSSVAEPELSPVVQSAVGSPKRETADADRLFPMPCAADPTPYVNPHNIEPQDYFGHRHVSSPLARERSSARSELHIAISRKPVGSPVRRRDIQSSNTVVSTPSIPISVQSDRLAGGASQRTSVPRDDYPRVEVSLDTQPLAEPFLDSITPSQKFDSFLDSILIQDEPGDQQESVAIATSSQSVLISQVETLRPSDQSPKGISLEKRYTSLRELPPVNLKDPFTARLPLSSHPIIPPIWAPPIIPASPDRQASHITTHTTITTGYDQLQPFLTQSDGPNDDTQMKHPPLQRKMSRIPLRTSSHQNSKRHNAQNTGSQTSQADIATSSEHLLAQTKQRTIRLCHKISPGDEKAVMKSTPISMSMSPQTPQHPEKVSPVAHTAALTAFQRLRHRAAMKKAGRQDREDPLTPPKLRRPKKETRDISPRAKPVVPGGQGDTESPSRVERDPDLYEKRLAAAVRAEGPGGRRGDSLVVWHPEPNEENKRSKVIAGTGEVMELACLPRKGATSPARKPVVEDRGEVMSLIQTHHNKAISPTRVESSRRGGARDVSDVTGHIVGPVQPKPTPEDLKLVKYTGGKKGGASDNKRASPKSATPQRPLLHISRFAFRIVQTAWWFVEPAFDPKSDLRKRWERGHALTWNDMGLCVAAAVFLAAMLLISVTAIRVLVLAMQVVRAFCSVLKIVTGF